MTYCLLVVMSWLGIVRDFQAVPAHVKLGTPHNAAEPDRGSST